MTDEEMKKFMINSVDLALMNQPTLVKFAAKALVASMDFKNGIPSNNSTEKSSPPQKPEPPLPEIPLVHKKEYYGDNVAEVATIIRNRCGVYPGRTASLLTQTANKFNSKIQFKAKGKTLDAKSILMWSGSGLQRGDEVTISATGSDAGKAVKALVELIDSKFGEE